MNDHDQFVTVFYQSKNQNTPLAINVLVQMLDWHSSPLIERAHWYKSTCQENSIREGSVSVLAFWEAS